MTILKLIIFTFLLLNISVQSANSKSYKHASKCSKNLEPPTDGLVYSCDDVRRYSNESGVYELSLRGNPDKKIEVYCKMIDEYTGVTVLQRRYNGYQSFNRNFFDYVYGFGDKNGEFWIGLQNLYILTNSIPDPDHSLYILTIELEDFDGYTADAHYDYFEVGPGPEYRLSFQSYSSGSAGDSLFSSNGVSYSTYDYDQDSQTSASCSSMMGGSWWYSNCGYSNLNSHTYYNYGSNSQDSMFWASWRGFTALKKSTMSIAMVSHC